MKLQLFPDSTLGVWPTLGEGEEQQLITLGKLVCVSISHGWACTQEVHSWFRERKGRVGFIGEFEELLIMNWVNLIHQELKLVEIFYRDASSICKWDEKSIVLHNSNENVNLSWKLESTIKTIHVVVTKF